MRKLVSFVLAVSCAVGCGDAGPRVVEVSGKITRQGRPVPGVSISFMPAEGRPSSGRADNNGNFKLEYTHERSGAVVGKHSVSVSYNAKDPGEEMDLQSGKKKLDPDLAAALEKYGKPETSPLKIEIKDPISNLEVKLD